jgi:SagB-type dehydrogenase family enzyme
MTFHKKRLKFFIPVLTVLLIIGIYFLIANDGNTMDTQIQYSNSNKIKLPAPDKKDGMPVELAINNRRSVRDYSDKPLTIKEVSQLLWSAQGITNEERSLRAAPSAGATYPLELYLVVDDVTGLEEGVYHYIPKGHYIKKIKDEQIKGELTTAALGQSFISDAPIILVISAVYERTTVRYGDRGKRYVHMEVGHVAENIYLQAESLDMGTVVVGAFADEKVKQLIGMKDKEIPMYIMPVGK